MYKKILDNEYENVATLTCVEPVTIATESNLTIKELVNLIRDNNISLSKRLSAFNKLFFCQTDLETKTIDVIETIEFIQAEPELQAKINKEMLVIASNNIKDSNIFLTALTIAILTSDTNPNNTTNNYLKTLDQKILYELMAYSRMKRPGALVYLGENLHADKIVPIISLILNYHKKQHQPVS